MYLYQGEKVDAGDVRETFLVNQLSYNQIVEGFLVYPPSILSMPIAF